MCDFIKLSTLENYCRLSYIFSLLLTVTNPYLIFSNKSFLSICEIFMFWIISHMSCTQILENISWTNSKSKSPEYIRGELKVPRSVTIRRTGEEVRVRRVLITRLNRIIMCGAKKNHPQIPYYGRIFSILLYCPPLWKIVLLLVLCVWN